VSVEPDADDATTPSSRIDVVGGGRASAEQLAALVVALTPVAGAVTETADRPPSPPAWTAAALREGVGRATVLRPSDLREPDRHG
jgi:hypothetical protein